MSAVGNQPFSATGVISQSFAVLRGNLGGFLLIALIVVVAMGIVASIVGGIFFGSAMMAGMSGRFSGGDMSSMDMMSLGITAVIGALLILVLILAIEQLGVAAITYGTVQDLRGRRALVGECLSRGLSLMLPVLGVALLYTLIVVVVPGIVGYVLGLVSDPLGRAASSVLQVAASLILYVAIPAAVIEGTGAIASLQRSADLTQGYRWRLLGMFFLVGLILLVAAAVIGVVIYVIMSISAVLGGIVIALAGIAMTLLFIAYVAALPAVTYYNLRVAKEGTDIAEIAKVFD
ncbi:MAG TPA: hypothetical protein VMQ73_14520 [Methylomirabilota bacterium]|nr:hypothetical protein [Methylomirabilota bacterium]